jgi:hypothetical protein
MSTEIEQYAPNQVGTIESYNAGAAAIREYAELMATAKGLAEQICRTSMVPDHFKGKPDECAAAMLYGGSLGLNPMQSVKAVYVVYGNAGLYARAMDAIVKAAGHETWTVEAGPEKVIMGGRRHGSNKIETAEWTIDRAIQAGYVPTIDPKTGKYAVNKNGKLIGNEKYLTDPETMLRAKATAEICRIIAPDVLNGVYSIEERETEFIQAEVVEVKRAPAPTKGLAAAIAQAPEQVDEPEPAHLTTEQSERIGALMSGLGITDRDNALAYVTDLIGRPIESRVELTFSEAEQVIASLEHDSNPADSGAEQ